MHKWNANASNVPHEAHRMMKAEQCLLEYEEVPLFCLPLRRESAGLLLRMARNSREIQPPPLQRAHLTLISRTKLPAQWETYIENPVAGHIKINFLTWLAHKLWSKKNNSSHFNSILPSTWSILSFSVRLYKDRYACNKAKISFEIVHVKLTALALDYSYRSRHREPAGSFLGRPEAT